MSQFIETISSTLGAYRYKPLDRLPSSHSLLRLCQTFKLARLDDRTNAHLNKREITNNIFERKVFLAKSQRNTFKPDAFVFSTRLFFVQHDSSVEALSNQSCKSSWQNYFPFLFSLVFLLFENTFNTKSICCVHSTMHRAFVWVKITSHLFMGRLGRMTWWRGCTQRDSCGMPQTTL